MSNANEDKPVLIKRGKVARALKDEQGRRKYGPFKVEMEVQMSKLSVVNDTLEFYIYQETGENAIRVASTLLKRIYTLVKIPFDGFPKPVRFGTATPISDVEYLAILRQADNEGREIEKFGIQSDPVAFHVKPRNTTVIVPPGFHGNN